MIYDLDHFVPKTDVEQTFSYPLDIVLKVFDEKLTVDFGARDGIKGRYLCYSQHVIETSVTVSLPMLKPKGGMKLLIKEI